LRYIKDVFRSSESDFLRHVIEDFRDGSRKIKVVLLGASDDERDVNGSFRDDYKYYVSNSDDNLFIGPLEKPPYPFGPEKYYNKKGEEVHNYWETRLDSAGYYRYRDRSYDFYRPYTSAELAQMIPRGVNENELPCFLIYRVLEKEHILIPIPDDMSLKEVFDPLLKTVLHVNEKIDAEVSELRKFIALELEMVPYNGAYASKPGSKARMKEVLDRARALKEGKPISPPTKQELKPGQVNKEDFDKEVESILAFRGAKLLSFDYFKKQFLTYYPDFQNGSDHLLLDQSIENEAYRSVLMERLTKRDIEVLKLIAQRKTVHEIADALMMVRFTVDTLRKNMIRKLELEGLKELYRFSTLVSFED